MTKAKNAVFIGLQLENCCLVGGRLTFGGGDKSLVGGVYCGGNFSSCEGKP